MTAVLISLIGPPASGKTTLAEALAVELSGKLIREDYAGNPFLAESYLGSGSARLPGQLYFLMSRVSQLWAGSWPGDGLFVSDYGFCQDRVYAKARLGNEDFALYDRLAARVETLVHPADVVVCLDAPTDTLLERIAARGRVHESAMTREFLDGMRREYGRIASEARCPIITVDTERTDPRDAGGLAQLAREIRAKL